ncbi:hypothetical protein OG298_37160 [Streptomyces sp. NBC_01005]|nr:hypothetical protein [Streptomyces sp. Wh19]MDV9195660.1 hypothetical protein [Streptomyces sp. Wh19]WSW09557.1 hypothetical protein OG298_37160 [Streptomyces sp. NBC_01005]WTC99062.1 hypothetical protein OH736_37150 [Streptomyces sp. NBC_01650]
MEFSLQDRRISLFGHICAAAPAIDGQLLAFVEGVTAREIEVFIGVAAQDLYFGFGLQGLDFPYGRDGNPVRTSGNFDSNTVRQIQLQFRRQGEGD